MEEFNIPQETVQPRAGDSFSPPGDYFAPFFDVVFYAPSALQGTIEVIEDQLRISPPGQRAAIFQNLASLREAEAGFASTLKSPIDIVGKESLGASRLGLRSVGGGIQNYDPAGPDSPLGQLVNYRANLQVTMLSAAALSATLTLTPPYEDALRIIDSQVIKFGSLMEVQWGYLSTDGSATPAISDKGLFRITQPSIKFGREVSITIGGFDILSGALSTQDVRCCWPRSAYPCDLAILRALIKKRGPGNTQLVDNPGVTSTSTLRKNKTEDVVQADDDWTFFRRLCRQNDVTFIQSGNTVTLSDEHRIDIAKPKYRLTWFMQPEGKLDIPMISFETNPIMGYFAGPGSRGQKTYCRNATTGDIEILSRDPSNTGVVQIGEKASDATNAGHNTTRIKTASAGDIAAFAELNEECASGKIYTQPCNRPNQTEETERANREVRRYHNTRATATVPGVPGLIPQQICEVINVGDVFSGCYRVMKTIHTIGAGYTVKVDLIRASSTGVKDGTAATRDRANCEPLDPDALSGENVTPKAGDDPPIISTEADNAGCVDATRTETALAARAIIRSLGIAGPSLADIDAQLQAPPAGP